MFERFSNIGNRVVVLSQEEARRLGHRNIGTEHVLLGLLGEEAGLASQVLKMMGLSIDQVRTHIILMEGTGESVESGILPYTPRAKKVFEVALREALHLSQNEISSEHILLALVHEDEGLAARILHDCNSDYRELIRQRVRAMLAAIDDRRRVPNRPPNQKLRQGIDDIRNALLEMGAAEDVNRDDLRIIKGHLGRLQRRAESASLL